MIERLLTVIVDESKWLTASLAAASVAVIVLLVRSRRARVPPPAPVVAAMSLFFAVTIGTMAAGHLLAVTIKLVSGTLGGSLALLYLIGVALAVPSWWLIAHATRRPAAAVPVTSVTLALNAWTAGTLLAMGLHNLPLAAPGLINVAYVLQSRRGVRWGLVALSVAVNLALLAGSLVFLASGQSFEQFRGIE